MEQWRRRLSVTMDSAAPDEARSSAQEEPADDMAQDEDAAGGNYEFVTEGERKQTGKEQLLSCEGYEQDILVPLVCLHNPSGRVV